MNPTERISSPSRDSEIWRRFAGMFGADSLERKFGKSIPPEWTAMLTRLNDREIDRGIRRLAYSGKPHVPSLPEFTKLCRTIGGEDVDEGPRRIALPPPESGQFDRWAIEANQHLLAYILRRTTGNPRCYGEIKPHSFKAGEKCFSEQQAEATAILVRYKNAWATDMREWVDRSTGELITPTVDDRRRTWLECMDLAEGEITRLLRVA